MTKLFKHLVLKLSTRSELVGVRVKGDLAYVLFGSSAIPASDISLKSEKGAWKINNLIGGQLP